MLCILLRWIVFFSHTAAALQHIYLPVYYHHSNNLIYLPSNYNAPALRRSFHTLPSTLGRNFGRGHRNKISARGMDLKRRRHHSDGCQ